MQLLRAELGALRPEVETDNQANFIQELLQAKRLLQACLIQVLLDQRKLLDQAKIVFNFSSTVLQCAYYEPH
jgi:hypothetical protein